MHFSALDPRWSVGFFQQRTTKLLPTVMTQMRMYLLMIQSLMDCVELLKKAHVVEGSNP